MKRKCEDQGAKMGSRLFGDVRLCDHQCLGISSTW